MNELFVELLFSVHGNAPFTILLMSNKNTNPVIRSLLTTNNNCVYYNNMLSFIYNHPKIKNDQIK